MVEVSPGLKLQPCDVGVFGPLKTAYRDGAESFCRGGFETVGKEHFTALYKTAREKAMTKRNITAAWVASGFIPFPTEYFERCQKILLRD